MLYIFSFRPTTCRPANLSVCYSDNHLTTFPWFHEPSFSADFPLLQVFLLLTLFSCETHKCLNIVNCTILLKRRAAWQCVMLCVCFKDCQGSCELYQWWLMCLLFSLHADRTSTEEQGSARTGSGAAAKGTSVNEGRWNEKMYPCWIRHNLVTISSGNFGSLHNLSGMCVWKKLKHKSDWSAHEQDS